jgi:membrane protease YdiL (CAAX protease family)
MNFSVIITLVTIVVIYFQVIKGNNFDYSKLLFVLPISIGFSLVNSFVEESITRLGVVIALKGIIPDKYIMVASGILFGSVHYFGTPGGLVGIFVAGFLGWFLAKSILETKGFFWAWLIHFLQDIAIITAMLAIE